MDTEYLESAFTPEPEPPTPAPEQGRPGWATALIVLGVLILVGQVALGALLLDRASTLDESVAANQQALDGVDARIDRLGSVVGVMTSRLDSIEASGASQAPVVAAPSGDALPPIPDGGPDEAIGLTLNAFTANDWTSGSEYTVGPSGTAKIVLIWAHWCPYCQQELPIVQSLVDDAALDGFPDVELVSVSTFEDPTRPNPLGAYLEAEQWDFPVLLDSDQSLAAKLGVRAVPAWVILDADNTVLGRFTGAIPREQVLGIFAELQRLQDEA
jgi:thiol-disulfide isomerase/thioredoxin